MKILSRLILLTVVLLSFSQTLSAKAPDIPRVAPQPTTCIKASFTGEGNQYWKTMTLKLTNQCNETADFQNATITFQTRSPLNTNFWGDFGPLSYPDNNLVITSQPTSGGRYLATLNLHFPTYQGSNSKLPVGRAINIKYGTQTDDHVDGSTEVFLGTTPPTETGTIELTNSSAKPANVSQNYALVHITKGGQSISDVQLPWMGNQTIPNLSVGTYSLSADSVTATDGVNYQGTVTPATLNLTSGQIARASVSYSAVQQQTGKITIHLQNLPPEISGYTGKPTATVTEAGTGSAKPVLLTWNADTLVSDLKNGTSYSFSTQSINFNGYQCTPSFAPTSLVASTTPPTTNLTYTCRQVAQSNVTVNVTGGPSTLNSLKVTFTPNNNTPAVSQTIALTNGSGSATVSLTTGTVYNVSADAVAGYSVAFNPQPLTAGTNTVETVTLSAVAGNTPVAINGQLHVCGTKLCNKNNQPIQLKGMSSHGLQWYGWGKCLTAGSLDALAKDFSASVIRLSLYVQEGGYETDPQGFTQQMNLLIEEATKRGIYVIVDWHMLTPGDPNFNFNRAQKFFTDIATAHKDKINLLYEIANEPNGVSWTTIKSYAERLIPIIRAIDPKTPILVGTVAWSSLGLSDGKNAQEIVNQPVNATNIMYTFHFYAASHRDSYLAELDRASNLIPIFVTEWGTQTFSGDGGNDFAMSDRYTQLMASKQISWTNWNYSDDFRSGAIWKEGTCPNGPWTDGNLKAAGVYIKAKIKA